MILSRRALLRKPTVSIMHNGEPLRVLTLSFERGEDVPAVTTAVSHIIESLSTCKGKKISKRCKY